MIEFKITLNNNVIKIIEVVCKEILLYSNCKVAKSCDNDGVDIDDVGGGDGKKKVDCEGEVDDDGDNDKVDCDDDADGGGGNSEDDGVEDGIFENLCIDREGGDEADDGDGQTESVADGLAKYSGSSKMEMTVGEMSRGILKETQQ